MVRVVTDSTSDLPGEIAEELGITVVPAYVHIDGRSYRDGIDIGLDQLYRGMLDGAGPAMTSAPAPGDFAEAYRKLSGETDGIVSVVVTAKQSAVYESALVGRESITGKCRIEVVDSQSVTMGLGLVAMAAARRAKEGASMDEVLATARRAVTRTYGMALLDTLKYALRGGRLSKAGVLVGSLVKVKPMLSIKSGVIGPCGVTRTREGGIERLLEFVKKHLPIDEVAVVYSTCPEEAKSVAQSIESLSPRTRPIMARLGSALGVHGGPGSLAVALREHDHEVKGEIETHRKVRKISLPPLRRMRH